MLQHRLGWGVTFLLSLVMASAVFAEVHPSDIRSGAFMGLTQSEGTYFTVPEGYTFVLTDFEWYPRVQNNDSFEVLILLGGSMSGNNRWSVAERFNLPSNTTFQTKPVTSHWTTGLVFSSGEALQYYVWNVLPDHRWDATWSGYLVSNTPMAVGDASPSPAPTQLTLAQNVPNPFNPTTEIKYRLAAPDDVKLRFFDAQGRMVRTLVDGHREAGEHRVIWDGKNDSGEQLASGVYYYQLGDLTMKESRKAILLK